MIEIKPLVNNGHEEMMVYRDDIMKLFQYLQIPDNDHACEHEALIECVYRLSKDFDIDVDDYVYDNSIIDEVHVYDNWERCVESAWHQ